MGLGPNRAGRPRSLLEVDVAPCHEADQDLVPLCVPVLPPAPPPGARDDEGRAMSLRLCTKQKSVGTGSGLVRRSKHPGDGREWSG